MSLGLRRMGGAPRLCLIATLWAVAALGLGARPLAAQTRDNKGTEFMLGFSENLGVGGNLVLFITGDTATSGTVEVPGLGFSTPFTVTPGATTQVGVSVDARVVGSDVTSQLGVRVTAADEVVVYGLNQIQFTTDAFLALPTDILGSEYVVMSYVSASGSSPSQLLVVGVEDGSQVTITPSIDTGTRAAGVPYTIVLDRFETYQLEADGAGEDLTGTLISADRPVAAFGGHRCANVPLGVSFCDHLVEQLPSVGTWGTDFLTVPLATRTGGDIIRVLARDNGTDVVLNGSPLTTLAAGQFVEIDSPSTAYNAIATAGPALVMQYSKGSNADGVSSDPFMMMVPPTEQFLPAYTLSTPAASPVAFTNFINVVAATADVSTCLLDGNPIAETFTPIGTSGFSGAQVPVDTGTHTVTCSSLFGAYAYGFATDDSYGYPGGLALDAIAVPCVPPTFDAPTPVDGATITVAPGTPVSFAVVASDFDAEQTVTLSVTDLPAGATMTPALSIAGNPISSTFDYTPPVEDLGAHTFTFRATDDCPVDLLQTTTTVTILVGEVVPEIVWITPPPPTAVGGDPIFVEWELRDFTEGLITENQVHLGINSIMLSSPEQPGTNGVHSFTFTAPNISANQSPKSFQFVAAALNDGELVTSPILSTEVSAGSGAAAVRWLAHGPLSVPSGGQFTVRYQVSDFDVPLTKNAVAWGVTTVVGQTPDQLNGNGEYETVVQVPEVTSAGTLYYAAFAQNTVQFAFAPILSIQVTVDDPVEPAEPPSAPPFLAVPETDDDGSFPVAWAAAGGVVGRYRLQEATRVDFSDAVPVFLGMSLSTTLTDREPGTYFYRIRACNSFGCSDFTVGSNPVEVTVGNRPPVADAGPDRVLECTEAGSTLVRLDATGSTDPDGVGDLAALAWSEGATVLGTTPLLDVALPVGTHVITLTLADEAGSTDTDEAVIIVLDSVPPTLIAPADIFTSCGDPEGTAVDLGTPTVEDACGAVVTNDAPALFPAGVTTVTWTATDPGGNTATDTQVVEVMVDTTPPALTAPATVTTECTDILGTPVILGVPLVADACGLESVGNNAPEFFPVGPTTVTWTAVDLAGNVAMATQLVTIEDTTPPTITAPADVSVETSDPAGTAVVIGTATAADTCGAVTVTNDAPGIFPPGTTIVTWTAEDPQGNTAADTQTVTVNLLCAVLERVSVDSAGMETNGASSFPSASGDGRFVAFHSDATDLVPGDTNSATDIFVHDRVTGATTRVSVDSSGTQADGPSASASISADGRFVAFNSNATNLVAGDTNGVGDVFVHDRLTGTTEQVSVDSAGVQGNGGSAIPSISANGRFVAFQSGATNLAAGDTNSVFDVFVHDRLNGITERVSVDSAGVQGNNTSSQASLSADGRFVAFTSNAANLVAGDTNGISDIFVHDRVTGVTERVSVDSAGVQPNGFSAQPSLSADGQFVAFQSLAQNLVPGDTNGAFNDVFVHDRTTGTTTRVSVASDGTQSNGASEFASISADGQFVAFVSLGSNLVPGDTNTGDIFVHDRASGVTTRVSVAATGAEANNSNFIPTLSADGRVVAFASAASNLVPGDMNGLTDIFVADNCLAGGCTLDVFGPADGDTWFVDTDVTVFWTGTTVSGGTVNVDFVQLEEPFTVVASIAANIPNVGFANWTVPGTIPPASDYFVRVQAADDAACEAFSTGFITIEANLPPVANAGTDQPVECTGGSASAPVTLDGMGSTDPNGTADIVIYEWFEVETLLGTGPMLTLPFSLGTHAVFLLVTDSVGNSDGDTVLITVQDTTPPTITAPADVMAECAGPAGTAVVIGVASAGDSCLLSSILNDAPALFPLGATLVTWTATDSVGNFSTDTQLITIEDTTAPTITAPADVPVATANPAGTAVDIGTAMAGDTCGTVAVSNDAPAIFPVGTTVVTWTADDGNGNMATDMQSVTVNLLAATVGVRLTVDPHSPQAEGAPVLFFAEGAAGTGAYEFQFSVDGGVLQAYSAADTFTWNTMGMVGPHIVQMDVRTAGVIDPTNVSAQLGYSIVAPAADCAVLDRASVDSAGGQADESSFLPSMSGDGRFVAFQSNATTLVAGDTNLNVDVFVRDRITGVTERVSVDSAGNQATGNSLAPSVSASGRFVAFQSTAADLVAGDTNGLNDVFVHDRVLGTTVRVSVDSAGQQATGGGSGSPSISADGLFVAFASQATNLVAADSNATQDVFIHDRTTGAITRVSVTSAGGEGNGPSGLPDVSADGRFVAFQSTATNLVAGDANAADDIFVRDRSTGATVRVSVDTMGVEANGASFNPRLGAGGHVVSFWSDASNLVAGDTNAAGDVFVHELGAGTTERVSVDSAGVEANGVSGDSSLSADGQFVAFQSIASNLVSGDANGANDIFVHARASGQTVRVNVDAMGVEALGSTSLAPSFSADGRLVGFYSGAPNLVPNDTNGVFDIFVAANCLAQPCGVQERVSLDSDGLQADNDSDIPSASADGRYVAFDSTAANLVANDSNGLSDIFVRDRWTGITERVSVASGGAQAVGGGSFDPQINADGRYVSFYSDATNLVAGDGNATTDIFVHDRLTGSTERVSVDSAGGEANGPSLEAAINVTGRFVSYYSEATNLVPGDTNAIGDVFVRDRFMGTTERISLDSAGNQGNNYAFSSSLSADGRFVAFDAAASNLVPDDTNGVDDAFVRDRLLGTTERVSVNSIGEQGLDFSGHLGSSVDGRFVLFVSIAPNLVPEDTGSFGGIFVHDRETGTTEQVNVDSTGTVSGGGGFAHLAAINADGRFVAFTSTVYQLVPGIVTGGEFIIVDPGPIFVPPPIPQVYVRDRLTNVTERVSVNASGELADNDCDWPAITGDGRALVFMSEAGNLVPDDTNFADDIFLADNCLAGGCSLNVLGPAAGATLTSPGQATILWTGTTLSGGTVNVDLLQGASVVASIAADTPNVGFVEWTIPSGLTPAADYTIRVQATDDAGCAATSGTIAIEANAPPVANAGADQVVECTGGGTAVVMLDGTASTDPNGTADIVQYEWSRGGGDEVIGHGAMLSLAFPLVSEEIQLVVTDGSGSTSSDTVQITVQDTLAPSITAPADVNVDTTDPLGAAVDIGIPDLSDLCGVVNAISDAPKTFPVGLTVVTWTADDGNGNMAADTQNVTVTLLAPDPVATLTVPAADNDGTYDLTWTASPGGGQTQFYELEEATLMDFSDAVQVFSGNALQHTVTGQGEGTFFYRVRACNSGGCSTYAVGANGIVVTFPIL